MTLFTLSFILFLIIDPIGNIPLFANAVDGYPKSKQRRIILREMLFALGVMLAFNFLGEWLIQYLELDEPTVRIAGGIILFLISIKILFPHLDIEFHRGLKQGEEPYLIPLAIPACAGPSLLATIMLFAHIEPDYSTTILAILFAWGLSLAIQLFSPSIRRALGDNVLEAFEKLMGMILILLAVQRLAEGVSLFTQTL